jgi:hypothetical protein
MEAGFKPGYDRMAALPGKKRLGIGEVSLYLRASSHGIAHITAHNCTYQHIHAVHLLASIATAALPLAR